MTKLAKFQTIMNEPEFEAYYGTLDEATVSAIKDEFFDRYMCDEYDTFKIYFKRNVNKYTHQYNELLRIEGIKIDPLVTKYLERQRKNKNVKDTRDTESQNETTAKTRNENGRQELNGRDSNNGHLYSTINNSGSDSETTHTDISNTETKNLKGTSRSQDVNSQFPQGNVSAHVNMDVMANINMTYASSMDKNGTDTTETGTITNAGDTDATKSGTNRSLTEGEDLVINNGEQHSERIDFKNGQENGTKINNRSKIGTEENKATEQEIYTGRDGIAAEVLQKTEIYIIQSNALKWLLSKLDICFLSQLNNEEGWVL